MSFFSYTYGSSDFAIGTTNVNIEDLQNIIKDSAITSGVVQYLDFDQSNFIVVVYFDIELSVEDKTILDEIIANYTYHEYLDIFATIKDVKPVGTNGGNFTSNSWQTRDINTIEGDVNFVSIDSNQITLQPGSYSITVKAPACDVRNHQCRLYNVTDSTYIMGSNAFSYNGVMTSSDIFTIITINDFKVYEIQHICDTTANNIGHGKATGFASDEVYTSMTIQKLS